MTYLHFLSVLMLLLPSAQSAAENLRPVEQQAVEMEIKKEAKNAFFLDLFGIGGIFGINYERRIFRYKQFAMGIQTGISWYELYDFNNRFNPDLIFPFSFNAYYGYIHHLEVGAGPTLSLMVKAHPTKFTPARDLLVNGHFTVGYRYQKPDGGFLFRIGYTPVFQVFRISHTLFYSEKRTLRHWGSVSVGYSF